MNRKQSTDNNVKITAISNKEPVNILKGSVKNSFVEKDMSGDKTVS